MVSFPPLTIFSRIWIASFFHAHPSLCTLSSALCEIEQQAVFFSYVSCEIQTKMILLILFLQLINLHEDVINVHQL